MSEQNEGWVSLNGCNACINTSVCKELGNCALLNIEAKHPENNKAKRQVIHRVRTLPHFDRSGFIDKVLKDIVETKKPEPIVRTWDGPVRLTVFEKMCIENLKKPR